MTYETTIIGAGFAGLTLAKALVEQGFDPTSICLVDDHGPNRGSNVPMALVHPFVGRSLQPRPGLSNAWKTTGKLLEEMALPSNDVKPIRLLRPFSDTKGNRLEKSYEQHGQALTQDFDIELLSQSTAQESFPFLGEVKGVVQIDSAYRLDLSALCNRLKQFLENAGVTLINEKVTGTKLLTDSSQIETESSTTRSKHLVFAPGAGLSRFFPKLSLAPTKGHLARICWKDAPPTNIALSMGGHLIHQEGDYWILGTTYFSPDAPISNPKDIFEQMRASLLPWIPSLENSTLQELWSGVRCIPEPGRKPLAGPLPNHERVFVLSGFGSKGVLWAPFLARELAAKIQNSSYSMNSDILSPTTFSDQWTLHAPLP